MCAFLILVLSGKLPSNSTPNFGWPLIDKEMKVPAPATLSRTKTKPERLEARLPVETKAIIQHAADLSGRSLSDFVVSSALAAAEETIRNHEVIVLSARDSIALAEALLNPREPNQALRSAFRLHRELFGPVERVEQSTSS